MAKRAFVPFERGEDGPALVGLMVMVEQVTGHLPRLTLRGGPDIGGTP